MEFFKAHFAGDQRRRARRGSNSKRLPSSGYRRPRMFAGVALMAVLFAACDIVGPDGDRITVVNLTGQPLVYVLLELDQSHLVDPILQFPVTPDQERLLAPGASATITAEEIYSYAPGDDVRLFLYEVSDELAELKATLTLTHEELERRGFAIEVGDWR